MDDITRPAPPQPREIPFEFTGTGGEYFRIWIVNLLLTILTLGIYSAWAKVRRLRYFYGSTRLAGASFDYHASPLAILKGRLVAVFVYVLFYGLSRLYPIAGLLLLPLLLFGLPGVIVLSRRFHLRMSSWRGLRFAFHGRYGGAMASFVGWPIAGTLTLGALWPLSLWKRVDWLLSNSAYGTQRFAFRGSKGMFYAISFIAGGLFLVVFLVAGVGLGLGLPAVIGQPAQLGALGGSQRIAELFTSGAFLLFLIPGALSLVAVAYYQSAMLNESWGNLHVGPHRVLSRLKTWPLAGIYITNMLGMLLTLGLFYPWAKVRQVRYQLASTSLLADDDLDRFTAEAARGTSAVGEEIVDFFDVDLSI